MKQTAMKYFIRAAVVLSLPLIVIGCFFFDSISQPEKALVDTELEITARIRIEPGTDNWNNPGRFVFAILAPKAWNLRQNATLSLTSVTGDSWRITPDVVDEPLTPMPSTEVDPFTKTPWPKAFAYNIGYGNNKDHKEDFMWTVWRSSSSFKVHDKYEGTDTAYETPIYATIKIKLKTGEEPITCDIGYAYGYDSRGFNDENGKHIGYEFRSITTYAAMLATTPSVFRYGDIFALQFNPKDTPLEGAEEVYLCGKARYNGGQTAEVAEAEARNRMDRLSAKLFEKYIYPKQFFDLPADAVIEELRFYFRNADGQIVVTDGEGYLVEQADE